MFGVGEAGCSEEDIGLETFDDWEFDELRGAEVRVVKELVDKEIVKGEVWTDVVERVSFKK